MADTPRRVREGMVVRKFKLGEEPPDDILDHTTMNQRIEMVWELCHRMWLIAGAKPSPYTRATMPVKVTRRR